MESYAFITKLQRPTNKQFEFHRIMLIFTAILDRRMENQGDIVMRLKPFIKQFGLTQIMLKLTMGLESLSQAKSLL